MCEYGVLPRGLATPQAWFSSSRRLMSLAIFMVVAALSLAWGAAAQPQQDAFVPAQSPNRRASGDGRGAQMAVRLDPAVRQRQRENSALVSSSPPPTRGGSSGTRGSSRGKGDIVFPEHERIPGRRLVPNLNGPPPCARDGSTFCEHIDNYPTGIVAETLENTVAYTDFFGNDSMPQPIGDRIGDETTLCPSTERIIFPKVGLNMEDQWMFIVNLDERFQQGIRVEHCVNENQRCLLTEQLPQPAFATCRQKYVFRKLLAVDQSGQPQPDSFRIPSCCACYVDAAVMARAAFGLNGSTSSRRTRKRSAEKTASGRRN